MFNSISTWPIEKRTVANSASVLTPIKIILCQILRIPVQNKILQYRLLLEICPVLNFTRSVLYKCTFLTEEMATEVVFSWSPGWGVGGRCSSSSCRWIAASCRLGQQKQPLVFPFLTARFPPSRRRFIEFNSQLGVTARVSFTVPVIWRIWP